MDSQRWSSYEEPEKAQAQDRTQIKSLTDPSVYSLPSLTSLCSRVSFGALMGFATGATVGTVNMVQSTAFSTNPKRAFLPNLNDIPRTAMRTGVYFSAYFMLFQAGSALLEAKWKKNLASAAMVTVMAGVPFVRVPLMRKNAPFLLLLVGMDYFRQE